MLSPVTDAGSGPGQPLPFQNADFTFLSKYLLLRNPWKNFLSYYSVSHLVHALPRALSPDTRPKPGRWAEPWLDASRGREELCHLTDASLLCLGSARAPR